MDKTELVAKVVRDLADDYHRRGGFLTSDHILRAVDKRNLEPEDDYEVRRQLAGLGIAVEEPESILDVESGTTVEGFNDDLVRRYLVEIGAVKLLNAEEEIILGRRIEAGCAAAEALKSIVADPSMAFELRRRVLEGQEAFDRLVSANLRLVVSVAKKYTPHTQIPLLDLIQDGTVGLIKAAEKFDYRKGFKFSTYATWWIRQSITRAIADKGRMIRLPVHVNENLSRINRVRRALAREKARNPTPTEIAEQLGWRAERVQFLLDVAREPISIDAALADEETEMSQFLRSRSDSNPESIALRNERSLVVHRMIAELSPREARILHQRFGLAGSNPMTLEQIGDSLKLTRERVRQIVNKALKKLGHPTRRRVLADCQEWHE